MKEITQQFDYTINLIGQTVFQDFTWLYLPAKSTQSNQQVCCAGRGSALVISFSSRQTSAPVQHLDA